MSDGRTVRAIVTCGTRVLGALPPFPVDVPWWVETAPIGAALEQLLGVPVAVLRLLSVEGGSVPRDGLVTYQVEVLDDRPVRDQSWQPVGPAVLAAIAVDDPRRPSYARPGGPAAEVEWADRALAALDRPRIGPAVQFKTWNLSCVHRLPTADGEVWAKRVNSFQTRESIVIQAVAEHDPTLVPPVLAADDTAGRILTPHVTGNDCWDADDSTVAAAIQRWVAVQEALAGRVDQLAGAGVPTWPLRTLGSSIAAMLGDPALRRSDDPAAPPRCPSLTDLTENERAALADRLLELPHRLAEIDRSGLPDTVVHGDFHPGNWRSDGNRLVIMDWADASISHPAIDLLGTIGRLPPERRDAAAETWVRAWRGHRRGSAPEAALDLVRPLTFLRGALLYQRFLDHIEPSEWIYHQADPAAQLRLALAAW